MLLILPVLLLLAETVTSAPSPPNFSQLECAIHQYAYSWGSAKIKSNKLALYAGLNLDLLCPNSTFDEKEDMSFIENKYYPINNNYQRVRSGAGPYYIATNGNDNNAGTLSAPFATFQRARDEIRKTPLPRDAVTVYVRGGTYYFENTLLLQQQDSGVTWINYQGEKVVLSGGKLLSGLTWTPVTSGSPIYVTKINLTNEIPPQKEIFRCGQKYYVGDTSGDDWDCSVEQNVDFAGNDIATTTATSPTDCCSKCQQNPACKFWTIEHSTGGTCWLKSSDAGRQTVTDHISGHPPPCSYEEDTDLSGNDVLTTTATSAEDCCNKCAANSASGGACKWYTIEHASGGTCWLKSSDSGRRAYEDHVSGQIRPPYPGPPVPVNGPAQVNALFVNGVRQVRARYPNGNPQDNTGTCFSKTQRPGEGCSSYINAAGGSGSLPSGTSTTFGLGPSRGKSPTHGAPQTNYDTFSYKVLNPPANHPVYNKPVPGIGWNNNSLFTFGSWPSIFQRTGGLIYNTGTWTKKTWAHPETGVVHMFHDGLWGNWQYQVSALDTSSHILQFGFGGWQEARGGSINTNHYYVENIYEELDVAGEWYFDVNSSLLYHYPNHTDLNSASTQVVLPLLNTIIAINGTSSGGYATSITVSGFEFTETRITFFEQYEAPSGGDATVHRGATLFVQDAEGIVVDSCFFNQTGGNAIILSNHVVNSKVTNNEITLTGDSGIVLLGATNLVYGTSPTYPNNNQLSNNHIHDFGIYGKQVSCVFSALAANTTISNNVCYNGPRAGLNYNDGFGGNNKITGNLVFNMVRETGDHGPYNSWDRQPYFTYNGINDGYTSATCSNCPPGASIIKAPDTITSNLIINGYNGVWTIDHDDGSQFMNDTANVMVWGGCKNYLGNSKSCDHNFIIYPGTDARSSGDRRCQTDDNGVFANQYYHDNDCITQDTRPYTWASCNPNDLADTVYQTWNNRFYAPNSGFSQTCGSTTYPTLQEWQKAGTGQDRSSSTNPVPDINTIIAMIDKMLGNN